MGAWDVSVFGNDDAADFLFEFDDAPTLAEVVPTLEDALDTALEATAELDAMDGAVGMAAAALVVSWDNPTMLGSEEGESLAPWPRSPELLPPHLATKAAQVLDRLHQADGNELAELWEEAGRTTDYQAELTRWRSRLP
jgi:hypothetical protein